MISKIVIVLLPFRGNPALVFEPDYTGDQPDCGPNLW
jgi:hypothetical protein